MGRELRIRRRSAGADNAAGGHVYLAPLPTEFLPAVVVVEVREGRVRARLLRHLAGDTGPILVRLAGLPLEGDKSASSATIAPTAAPAMTLLGGAVRLVSTRFRGNIV